MRRLFLLLLLLSFQLSFATVVVNSLDGRDVVSGIYHAANTGEDVLFVTPLYNEGIFYGKLEPSSNILLIQSADSQIISGLANSLESRGHTVVETYISEEPYETNLEFAEKT